MSAVSDFKKVTMAAERPATAAGRPRVPLRLNAADAAFTTASTVLFGVTSLVFIAARLWRLTTYNLTGDEVFSLEAVRQSWGGMMAAVVRDVVHPPLFYILFKLWVIIGGQSLLWMKLFPLIFSVATIIPFFFLCRELNFRAGEINFTFALMAVNGYLVFQAQMVRMYDMELLLTLFSLWLFVRFYNSQRQTTGILLALTVVNLTLIYTHYYGWLVIGAQTIFLLIRGRDKLRGWTISLGVLGLSFLPWAYIVTQAALNRGGIGRNGYAFGWAHKPGLSSLSYYYSIITASLSFSQSAYLRLILFGFPILLVVGQSLRNRDRKDTESGLTYLWLLLLAIFPVACIFLASQFYPQWHVRFLIISALPFMILVSIAVQRLRPVWLRATVMVLVLLWASISGFMEALARFPYVNHTW